MAAPTERLSTPGATPDAIHQRLIVIVDVLKQDGITLASEVYDELKRGLDEKSIKLTFLNELDKAGDAFWNLHDKEYVLSEEAKRTSDTGTQRIRRFIDRPGLEDQHYLSDKDVDFIAKTKNITSLDQLELIVRDLPKYSERIRLIDSLYPAAILASSSPDKGWVVEGKKISVEMVPLTADEVKKIQGMTLEKGVEWLKSHRTRINRLQDAVKVGIIEDQASYKLLRDMPPAQCIVELDKAQSERDDEELRQLNI